MAYELVYTSAPAGVFRGSSGFCVVACTQGLGPRLVVTLESLSAYKPLYPHFAENAWENPVSRSHYLYQANGELQHILSRICFNGVDYTQRSNKLASHLVLSRREAETAAGGPASLMLREELFKTENWQIQAEQYKSQRTIPATSAVPAKCATWEKLTGDAGWGGYLAQCFRESPQRNVYLAYAPEQHREILQLLHEALSLLPPEQRWQVTFNTYFVMLPAGMSCTWRCCPLGTEALRQASRSPTNIIIDLAHPRPLEQNSDWIELARTGSSRIRTSQNGQAAEPAAEQKEKTREAEPSHSGAEAKPILIRSGAALRETAMPAAGDPAPSAWKKHRKLALAIVPILILTVAAGIFVHVRRVQRDNLCKSVLADCSQAHSDLEAIEKELKKLDQTQYGEPEKFSELKRQLELWIGRTQIIQTDVQKLRVHQELLEKYLEREFSIDNRNNPEKAGSACDRILALLQKEQRILAQKDQKNREQCKTLADQCRRWQTELGDIEKAMERSDSSSRLLEWQKQRKDIQTEAEKLRNSRQDNLLGRYIKLGLVKDFSLRDTPQGVIDTAQTLEKKLQQKHSQAQKAEKARNKKKEAEQKVASDNKAKAEKTQRYLWLRKNELFGPDKKEMQIFVGDLPSPSPFRLEWRDGDCAVSPDGTKITWETAMGDKAEITGRYQRDSRQITLVWTNSRRPQADGGSLWIVAAGREFPFCFVPGISGIMPPDTLPKLRLRVENARVSFLLRGCKIPQEDLRQKKLAIVLKWENHAVEAEMQDGNLYFAWDEPDYVESCKKWLASKERNVKVSQNPQGFIQKFLTPYYQGKHYEKYCDLQKFFHAWNAVRNEGKRRSVAGTLGGLYTRQSKLPSPKEIQSRIDTIRAGGSDKEKAALTKPNVAEWEKNYKIICDIEFRNKVIQNILSLPQEPPSAEDEPRPSWADQEKNAHAKFEKQRKKLEDALLGTAVIAVRCDGKDHEQFRLKNIKSAKSSPEK